MIDLEMVQFLTRKRDEAAADAKRTADELARCEATLQQYLSGGPVSDELPPDDEDDTKPFEIWNQVLANGVRLTRQEMFAALKAGGWVRQYEKRSFSKAINTNVSTGNIALDADGRYYKPTPQERERILNAWREQRLRSK